MEKPPFFSCVMPSFNSEKYIVRAIESMLRQSFEDFELLIVDDSSVDKSREIIRDFEAKDGRVKGIYPTENKGAGAARNVALKEAKGEFAVFLDSDDFMDADFLASAYEIIKDNPDADGVKFGGIEEYVENDNVVYRKVCLPEKGKYISKREIFSAAVLMEETPLFGYPWNGVYRMKIIREHNVIFNEHYKMNEDFLFNIAFFKTANVMITVDKAFCHYQKGAGSLSTSANKDYLKHHIVKIESFLGAFEGNPPKELLPKIYWQYFRIILSALERENESTREELINQIKTSELYKGFLQTDFSKETLKRRLLIGGFKLAPLMLSKLVSYIRKKSPVFFAKVKR